MMSFKVTHLFLLGNQRVCRQLEVPPVDTWSGGFYLENHEPTQKEQVNRMQMDVTKSMKLCFLICCVFGFAVQTSNCRDPTGFWPPSCWPSLPWFSQFWAWTLCCATTVPCSTKGAPAPTSPASVCPTSAAPAPGADTARSTSFLPAAAWTPASAAPMKSHLTGASTTMWATPAAVKTDVMSRRSRIPNWRYCWGWSTGTWITLTSPICLHKSRGIPVQITHFQWTPHYLPMHRRCACRSSGKAW